MGKTFEEIKRLMAANAVHRKGTPINIASVFHAQYAIGECQELLAAENAPYPLIPGTTGPSAAHIAYQLEELADARNCLDIYAVSKGFTEEQIEAEQLRKLALRFTIPEDK